MSSKLTIFTLPKAFQGRTALLQHHAIQSWMQLTPTPEILLLGNDPGVSEYARQYNLSHCPDIECSETGVPLMSSIFQMGQACSKTPYVAYVNTDIILDGLSQACLAANLPERFLMVGRRKDLMLWDALDFSNPDWLVELKSRVESNGMLFSHYGSDYFLFPNGLFDHVPPFMVGRMLWDNWVMAHILHTGVALVDATRAIFAVHQEHDYGHIAGGYTEAFVGKGAEYNKQFMNYDIATVLDANYCLKDGAVLPMEDGYKLPPNSLELLPTLCWHSNVAEEAALRRQYEIYRSKERVLDHAYQFSPHVEAHKQFRENFYRFPEKHQRPDIFPAGEAALRFVPHSGISRCDKLFRKIRPMAYAIRVIRRSGLFDEAYYRKAYANLLGNQDSVSHYVREGEASGLKPAPWFSPQDYLQANKDVAQAGLNAFFHFVETGHKARRRGVPYEDIPCPPCPSRLQTPSLLERILWKISPQWATILALHKSGCFDKEFYQVTNPEAVRRRKPLLRHYVRRGAQKGRRPAPWFYTAFYMREHPEIAESGMDPFYHYLRYGCQKGFKANHVF